jgi:ABC-type nitrate/sulfonate/bicarbonate transport system ATPase subunit
VLGNLLLAGATGGQSRDAAAARAHELLDRFRLSPRAHAYPAELSGGERQRAAIAQQIMVPRRVLLMDEPWSGLDPRCAHEMQKLVFEVADADDLNSVIIVTHDVRAAVTTADQLVVLGRSPAGEGAAVRASWDLVEHGVCALPARACGQSTAPLEDEIRELFLDL